MENSNHLTESWSLPWQSVLSSQLWRLEHLYWIENKAGQLQRFSLNRAQRRLHERLWYRNDILKARQLGISTYVAMLMLDMSLFRSNFHCGIIDKSLPDAQQKLAKLHFAKSLEFKGEKVGVLEMRRHFSCYFKGLPDFKSTRLKLVTLTDPDEIRATLDYIAERWKGYDTSEITPPPLSSSNRRTTS